ncbi:MAG: hypothetical protein KGI37_05270 [Alphaproteobacteria bacterium]|nr:hypothetical protein [Alphaproteobacteria bacterium]
MKKQSPLTVHIPINLTRKSGRTRIILPNATSLPQIEPEENDHLILVLARAHAWQKLLFLGKMKSAEELATQMKISHTYVCRVLRLALLAPDIKLAILDGQQPKGLRVLDLLKPFPLLWHEQRTRFGFQAG